MTETDHVQADTFESFYRSEYPGAVRLAHLLTSRSDIAEDLAQDAFARIQVRFGRLTNPPAYLRTTVVNLCRSWHRRRRRAERGAHLLVTEGVVPLGAVEVLDAIDALPWKWKAVIVLRYWEALSEAEIAEALHCPPGTVKTWAARALARLERELPS